MKYHKEKNDKSIYKENTINVETIFDELDLLKDDLSQKTYTIKRSRYINTIKEILDEYKKKAEIKGYKINKGAKNVIKSFSLDV